MNTSLSMKSNFAGNTGSLNPEAEAQQLFQRMNQEAKMNGWLAGLLSRPTSLMDLSEIETSSQVRSRHYAGVKSIPVSQIQGSVGRSTDFDRKYRPLGKHTRERWVSVAKARLQDKSLPPITVVQVGEQYFVVDGNHRVSVAQALGDQFIDAEVTVWQVREKMPVCGERGLCGQAA